MNRPYKSFWSLALDHVCLWNIQRTLHLGEKRFMTGYNKMSNVLVRKEKKRTLIDKSHFIRKASDN
jgi:hypothetical protein